MAEKRTGKAPEESLAREQSSRFDRVYSRDDATYGEEPSPELASYVEQCVKAGRALDLGAGLGRDAIALARRGLHVTAVDLSGAGLERIAATAATQGLEAGIETRLEDARRLDFGDKPWDVIVAATVLDHMTLEEATRVLDSTASSLGLGGVLYVEVHTTEDPGSPVGAGSRKLSPESETAAAVVHYFRSNELLGLLAERFRVIFYEERLEYDRTHGRPHEHGKAVALCVHRGAHPQYFGEGRKGLQRD